jgi:hypothetical protein
MAPGEDCSTPPKNQPPPNVAKVPWRKRRAHRPRRRVCLLKGCGRIFRPEQPLARYCSEACREQARRWREWKSRRRYRRSPNGQQRRQAQSHRYRERRRERQAQETAAVTAARVIPTNFFSMLLRPPWMLCGIRAHPAFALTTLLFPCLPPRSAASSAAGEALARTALEQE